METENSELRQKVEHLEQSLEKLWLVRDLPLAPVCPIFPPIDALVVDRLPELIVLDKGSAVGVEVGFVFDVYRGATYKGQIRIVEVQEERCSGVILHEKKQIERGDSATTRL